MSDETNESKNAPEDKPKIKDEEIFENDETQENESHPVSVIEKERTVYEEDNTAEYRQDDNSNDNSSWIHEGLSNIRTNITNQGALLLEARKNRKIWIGIVLIIGIFLFLNYSDLLVIPTWIVVVIWIIAIFFLLAIIGSDVERLNHELDGLEDSRKIYESFLGINDETKYFHKLVQININNLREYYSLIKIHTAQSFRTSLFVGILGFTLIIAGVAIGFFRNDLKDISYLTGSVGVLTEFISGVFFYLYNKTVRELKGYHDSLLEVQNVLMSFKLVEDLQSQETKAEMIKAMIGYLVNKSKSASIK